MSAEPSPASTDVGATGTPQGAPDAFTRERWAWLKQVAADDGLTPFAFRVAFILADHLNRESRLSWPSQDRIGEVLRATRKGIQGAIAQLAERDHIAVIPSTNRKGGNRYRPILQQPVEDLDNANGSTHEHISHVTHGSHEDDPHATRGSTVMPPAGGPNLLKEPVEIERDSIPAPARPKRRPATAKAKTSDDDFGEWWAQVPRAVGKVDARKAYDKVITSGAATHADLLAGMMRYAAERQGQDPQYTKHPSTWLNKGCWADAPAQPQPTIRDQPMTRTQASRSEARQALEAIQSGMSPEDVSRGMHLNSKGRRMVNANRFMNELNRRNGTHTEYQSDAIIIDNDDQWPGDLS